MQRARHLAWRRLPDLLLRLPPGLTLRLPLGWLLLLPPGLTLVRLLRAWLPPLLASSPQPLAWSRSSTRALRRRRRHSAARQTR